MICSLMDLDKLYLDEITWATLAWTTLVLVNCGPDESGLDGCGLGWSWSGQVWPGQGRVDEFRLDDMPGSHSQHYCKIRTFSWPATKGKVTWKSCSWLRPLQTAVGLPLAPIIARAYLRLNFQKQAQVIRSAFQHVFTLRSPTPKSGKLMEFSNQHGA